MATALGVAAIHQGKAGNLAKQLTAMAAVILDELGYLPFPASGGTALLSANIEFIGGSTGRLRYFLANIGSTFTSLLKSFDNIRSNGNLLRYFSKTFDS